MRSNISSTRLNEYVKILADGNGTDDYGQPIPDDVLVFDARANVDVKPGNKLVEYGTTLTNDIISCLMYFDERIRSAHKLDWNGRIYNIDHIQPDEFRKGMIVTCSYKEA